MNLKTIKSKDSQKEVVIRINHIFDELIEENKRLKNELLFANKRLNVFNEFKSYLYQNYINKCKSNHIFNDFNSNQLKHLEKEFDSICGQKLSIDPNVKTAESIESEELNEKKIKLNEDFVQPLRRSDRKVKHKIQNETQLKKNKILNNNKRKVIAKKKTKLDPKINLKCDSIGCHFYTNRYKRHIS